VWRFGSRVPLHLPPTAALIEAASDGKEIVDGACAPRLKQAAA